jgi:hypothetical protein
MKEAYIVTGRLTDDRTVVLDEPLPVADRPVKLVIEVDPGVIPGKGTMAEAVALLRERQRARGHVAIPSAEIDALMGWSNEDDGE